MYHELFQFVLTAWIIYWFWWWQFQSPHISCPMNDVVGRVLSCTITSSFYRSLWPWLVVSGHDGYVFSDIIVSLSRLPWDETTGATFLDVRGVPGCVTHVNVRRLSSLCRVACHSRYPLCSGASPDLGDISSCPIFERHPSGRSSLTSLLGPRFRS